MLIKNNPSIKVDDLTDKMNEVIAHRHHAVLPDILRKIETDVIQEQVQEQEQEKTVSDTSMIEEITMNNSANSPRLSRRQKLRNLPYLGFIIAWVNAFLKLPQTRKNLAMLEYRHNFLEERSNFLEERRKFIEERNSLLEERSNLYALQIADLNRHVIQNAGEIQEGKERLQRYDNLSIGQRLMEFDKLHIARQFRSIQQVMSIRKEPSQILIESSGSSGSYDSAETHSAAVGDKSVDMDQFYVDFEKIFRGSCEEIKQRLMVYLPFLEHISNSPKRDRLKVIDVGCGRGEWLELLDENEIPGFGIDMNVSMVEACLSRGLAAKCGDAIAFLKQQTPNSIGAVTGFHIIEHLSFEDLLALFDAALHALCPGGVIIFETPNPENMKVGSCNFYFDPTHRNPIVPQVAEFIARQRGFAHAEILRLHPYPDDHLLTGNGETEQLLNKIFYGPQDYAVIARKSYAA